MRKHLPLSLSACLVTASLVGCGDKSQDVLVSEQLDELLDQMSRLQYADAPIEGNELTYTLGKEVNGVKVPGSTRFEAAYLDQALALLPKADAIVQNGTPLQKESAYAIIGSIRIDEASFLIDEAERSFQTGARDVVSLRSKLAVLQEISALNSAVAGDRSEVIETYQTGLKTGGANITGISGFKEQAAAFAGEASAAGEDLAKHNEEISKLREKVAEYEALELKLEGQARTSQSTDKYDKLDQATAAAKEAGLAEAMAQKFEIDAWISERVANLAEFKRQQLAGEPQSSTADLLGKLDGFFAEASQETNIPDSSDTYAGLAQMLARAKATTDDDTMKAAAFLLDMSSYGTADAADLDERKRLVAAMSQRVNSFLGTIGVLEMKIAQIRLDRQRVDDKLAEIDRDRQAVIAELEAAFAKHDAMIQAAGFDRMGAAIASLELAEQAVQQSGNGTDMELMSVYLLHARVLHQQALSARSYLTTLSSIAAAGPELLGSNLHTTLSTRVQDMESLLVEVGAAGRDLDETAASGPMATLLNTDGESARGQIASRQLEVFQSIIDSLPSGGGVPSDDTDTPEEPEPAAP